MRRRIVLLLAAAAALCACRKEELVPETGRILTAEGRVITVHAAEDTKTAVEAGQGGGYTFTWNQNDAIRLFEAVYENYGSGQAKAADIDFFFSDGVAQDAPTASFAVDLNSVLAAPEGAKYRYVATYPSDLYYDYYWTGDGEPRNDYESVWPDSECAFNHPVLYAEFPYAQHPVAGSFDPLADLMVSRQAVLDARAAGSLQLRFARVGALVKMHLTGLAAGEKVETGYLLFGDSYKVRSKVEYDPELSAVRFVPGDEVLIGKETYETDYRFGFNSASAVAIDPTDVYVAGDGSVDLWLRLPEGVADDSFSVRVWTRAYELDEYQYLSPGAWHSFGKSVDLASAGRSLRFENGRLTTFSVATQVMEDPYLRLSGSFTDAYGGVHDIDSSDGHISVGKYEEYLAATGGTVVLDVETNADPADVVISNYSNWVDAVFDSATMKLTLTYNPCTEYTNYMVSSREATLYAELTSFAGATVQIGVNQLKPYFADSGTRKSILTWHGGSVTGLVRCNTAPVIECPEDGEHAVVSWVSEKTETGYNVTFTAVPNESGALSAMEVFIRDAVSPSTKYVQVNLLRYPKVADGAYYILTQNTHNGTPYHWFGVGADLSVANPNAFACDVTLDGGNNPDVEHTDNLIPFTFTRIEGEEEYRITCKRGDITYYLSYGSQRQSGQYYLTLNPSVPLTADNGRDASKWDVVSLGAEIAIRNHVYPETPYVVHYKLDDPSVYLRRASSIEITDNQGSYGTSYFSKATTWADSWNGQAELPCNVRLYDADTATYLPQPY